MKEDSENDRAEEAVQRRARIATAMGVVLIVTQMTQIGGEGSGRLVDKVQLGGWTLWIIMLLLFIAFGGALFRNRSLYALLNDESSLQHRQQALASGFWGFIVMAALLGGVTFFEPLAGRDAIQLMVTFGVGTALLAFGWLERRALA